MCVYRLLTAANDGAWVVCNPHVVFPGRTWGEHVLLAWGVWHYVAACVAGKAGWHLQRSEN